MKRVTSACLLQTNHFETKEDAELFLALLDRKCQKYKVEGQDTVPSGGIDLKIRREYNNYPVGSYLD